MQTVDRIINLLEFLSKNKDGKGIKEISETLDLPLSTTHRMLNSLKDKGYVYQDKVSKEYKTGLEVLSLAINLLNDMDIIKISRPIIEDLSTKHGQLVYLSIFEDDKIICVDMVNNAKRTKFYVQIGTSMPIYCAASAKVIAAYLDETDVDHILENTNKIKYTSHTKLDDEEIKKEYARIREEGYAICDEEMELGVKAISTPIFGRDNRIHASITTMIIKQLEYDEDNFINDLKQGTRKISKLLGNI